MPEPFNLRKSSNGRWAAIILLVAAVAAAGTWAVMTILQPAEDPLSSTEHSFVTVRDGSVSDELSLNTLAEWPQRAVGTNRAAGVVTSIDVDAGESVSSGTVLYTVDLRPVVVARGAVPMFRPMGPGAEGEDVRQLQEMLRDAGQYGGSLDGMFGGGTANAVGDWQRSRGARVTGVVDVGDVIFVPDLPMRVTLDASVISRGAMLSGGETVLKGLTSAPSFEIPVTEGQAALTPAGTRVEITAPDGKVWDAAAQEQVRSDDGAIRVRLGPQDGGSVCGQSCAEVPPLGKTPLRSRIIVVEEVRGLVVPSAALVTTADGTTAVLDAKDRRIPVTVLASANGMSAITGADEGLRVQLPADDSGSR